MKNPLCKVLCALTVLLLTVRLAVADGIVCDTKEAISGGRGGTNIAHSDNGTVLLSNPAGMLNAPGRGIFEVGTDTLITDMRYSNTFNNDVSANNRPISLPMVSYFQKSSDGDWAAGIGVFAPAGFAAGWDFFNPVQGNQPYQSFGALVKILPAFAYRVADNLSVGATLGLAASYAELDTPFYLQTGPFAGAPLHMHLRGGDVSPTWSVGLQYDLSDQTTVGAVYSSEDRFNLCGHMTADVFGLGPFPVSSHFKAITDLVWPQSAGIGIKHKLNDAHRVSADVVWFDWSHAFDRVDLQLTNSSNPIFPVVFGPVIHDSIALNWRDSVSVRTGYEWFYSECNTLRLGYVYNSSVIPSSTLTPLIPGILEHAFTIGHGTSFDDWRFDAAYQYSFGPERHVNVSALAGGDFSFSTVSAQAHWISLNLTHQF